MNNIFKRNRDIEDYYKKKFKQKIFYLKFYNYFYNYISTVLNSLISESKNFSHRPSGGHIFYSLAIQSSEQRGFIL